MESRLSDLLRELVAKSGSISVVARGSGVPASTLQEFVYGKRNGTTADLRLTNAERLIDFFGIRFTGGKPAPRKKEQSMSLKAELKAHGLSDSTEKFKERLRDALESQFPNYTIDDLLCEPAKASAYCEHLRLGIDCEEIGSHVFLKALVNMRKAGNGPTTPDRDVTRRPLSKKLEEAGSTLEPRTVSEKIVDEFASMYKSRTVDDVLCYPAQASDFCQVVRRKLGDKLPDKLILQTLMNERKCITAVS